MQDITPSSITSAVTRLFLLNQCTMTEPHYAVECGCGRVRQYKGQCLSNLTLYKDCKSFSLSHQIHALPPLVSSSGLHYPQPSPPRRVREYVSTHLLDRSTWPGWRRDAESRKRFIIWSHVANNTSEQKLVTCGRGRLDGGSPAEFAGLIS